MVSNNLQKLLFLSLVCLFVLFSCKKETKNTEPSKPDELSLTLFETQCYQYGTVLITSNKTIATFNDKVFLSGAELKATKLNDTSIGFIVPPEIGGGAYKLSLDVNGSQHFEFDLKVNELPKISNPDIPLNNYRTLLDELDESVSAAYDSICKRAGIVPSPEYVQLQADIGVIKDSLNAAKARFDNLSHEEKLIAAAIVEADRLDLAPILEEMKAINEELSSKPYFGKSSMCPDAKNISEEDRCMMNKVKLSTSKLAFRLLKGTAVGGIAGSALPVLGTGVGMLVGFATVAFNNRQAIAEHLSSLIAVNDNAFEVVNQELNLKSEFLFNSNEATTFSYYITRRTPSQQDENSSYLFIKDYVTEVNSFNKLVATTLSAWINGSVKYSSPRKKNYKLEDISYLSVSVSDNPKVQFVSLTGTNQAPVLKFKTDESTDQYFKFKIKYDDGVFVQETEYDGKVSPSISMTLNDSTMDNNGHIFFFDVICSPTTSWTLSTDVPWMLTTRTAFTGPDHLQLGVQENKDGVVRTGHVTLKGINKTIVVTITQNPACIGDLKVTMSRNGKVVTASGTGGKSPYTYCFLQGPAFSHTISAANYTSSNTTTLTFDGYYQVFMKDANGCIDSASGCISDITNLVIAAAGWQNSSVKFTVSYKSSLGLLPSFLNSNRTLKHWKIRGVNMDDNTSDYLDISKWCSKQSSAWSNPPVFKSESGTVYEKTLTYSLMAKNPGSPTSITLRFTDYCNGVSLCTDNYFPYFSPEITLNW